MNDFSQIDTVHNMDCLKGLRMMPSDFVDCCVTSPPYYGLRDYGIVLDPFMGTGTTAMVARKYQRHFVGFELNPDYMSIIDKKTQVTPLLFP